MNRQVSLEEIYHSAFKDEFKKIAADPFRVKKLVTGFSNLSRKKKALVVTPVVATGSVIPIQGEYKPNETKDIDPQIKRRWTTIKKTLGLHGAYAGTGHKRIVIPKEKLSKESIKELGFKKSYIAVPEAGQNSFVSYRHPDHNYHIHSHIKGWTVHRDRHSASQMLANKARSIAGKAGAYTVGAQHLITEGIPGFYNYAKNKAGRIIRRETGSLAKNVRQESGRAVRNIRRWKNEVRKEIGG